MKYKIYILKHPITDEIRYVGFTSQRLCSRLSGHIYQAKNKRDTYYSKWVYSLLKDNLKPVIQLIDETEDKNYWPFLEKYWIAQFKAWGFKLTNLTEGGEGTPGVKPNKSNCRIKKIYMYSHDKKFISEYNSSSEIADILQVSKGAIHFAARNNSICKGYFFSYIKYDFFPNNSLYKRLTIPVYQYDLEGNFVKEWNNFSDVLKELGGTSGNLVRALKNENRTFLGFQWRYSLVNKNINMIKEIKGLKKKTIQIDLNDKVLNVFESAREAEKQTGVSYQSISLACKNKNKTAGGYKWINQI